ncbi:cytochrome C oxidase subunit IV family protein [Spongiibacter pelagi]|nr:cytochrome C oxidase subunit IV family protein [Spongiibacter pelagi]
MRELLLTRESFVWLILMSATAVAWIMSTLPSFDEVVGNSSMILLIAFFKVRLVVVHFMEAGHAPAALRWACETVIVLACVLVLTFYHYGDQLVAAGFPVS